MQESNAVGRFSMQHSFYFKIAYFYWIHIFQVYKIDRIETLEYSEMRAMISLKLRKIEEERGGVQSSHSSFVTFVLLDL